MGIKKYGLLWTKLLETDSESGTEENGSQIGTNGQADTLVLDMEWRQDAIRSIPGEVVLEAGHAAFYTDETELYELILNTFYIKLNWLSLRFCLF